MILLVDDEDMIIAVGREILKAFGYDVAVAKSGKEAVAIFERDWEHIQLVILDMIMPGMNGLDTFKEMQRINPSVKVLLASGYSLDGQTAELIQRGSCGFLHKPFNIKDLAQKIDDMIGTK